jgi:hypothetical protein
MPVAAKTGSDQRHSLEKPLRVILAVFWLGTYLFGQTASTGAMIGVVLDPSGAAVPGVMVGVERRDGIAVTSVDTDETGQFGVLLLEPGTYLLTASKSGFKTLTAHNLRIPVTETIRVVLHLELLTHTEEIQVTSDATMTSHPGLGG